MSIGLVTRKLFRKKLVILGKQADIVSFPLAVGSASVITRDYYEGWRPANKAELEEFAKKYRPAGWYPPVIGFGTEVTGLSGLFGKIIPSYKVEDGRVSPAGENPIHGFPSGTLFLFIKADR